jgi:hypothetical protein
MVVVTHNELNYSIMDFANIQLLISIRGNYYSELDLGIFLQGVLNLLQTCSHI